MSFRCRARLNTSIRGPVSLSLVFCFGLWYACLMSLSHCIHFLYSYMFMASTRSLALPLCVVLLCVGKNKWKQLTQLSVVIKIIYTSSLCTRRWWTFELNRQNLSLSLLRLFQWCKCRTCDGYSFIESTTEINILRDGRCMQREG